MRICGPSASAVRAPCIKTSYAQAATAPSSIGGEKFRKSCLRHKTILHALWIGDTCSVGRPACTGQRCPHCDHELLEKQGPGLRPALW